MEKTINIEKWAKMAKLEFNNEEINELSGDLARFNDLVKVLDSLPEEDGMFLSDCSLRPDEIIPSEKRNILMKNAPESTDGFFTVPEIGGSNE